MASTCPVATLLAPAAPDGGAAKVINCIGTVSPDVGSYLRTRTICMGYAVCTCAGAKPLLTLVLTLSVVIGCGKCPRAITGSMWCCSADGGKCDRTALSSDLLRATGAGRCGTPLRAVPRGLSCGAGTATLESVLVGLRGLFLGVLGIALLGTVVMGIVLLGIALLGTAVMGIVMLGIVLLGTAVMDITLLGIAFGGPSMFDRRL